MDAFFSNLLKPCPDRKLYQFAMSISGEFAKQRRPASWERPIGRVCRDSLIEAAKAAQNVATYEAMAIDQRQQTKQPLHILFGIGREDAGRAQIKKFPA
ncbi:hypothetical protein CDQ91_07845 [Sphingopyxis witflariensis]|uniref:Uncharacterized protein n=1 Tax=Sphingopyxis witflariensis TaxID=173675 RepID=A0A246K0L3_9SPHN|nr:hypothetical protein CDQ91_07845 [Sphingopyxis witflariensis]